MRRFHSYGPVDDRYHYCVRRKEMISRCTEQLFGNAEVPFTPDADRCNYAYLHGIIDHQTYTEPDGRKKQICRFTSPFVQLRIYNALTYDLVGDRMPILALYPLDKLTDVFGSPGRKLPAP